MHFRLAASVTICLLLTYTLVGFSTREFGQTSQVSNSSSKLVEAFKAVQKADQLGVSSNKILQLTNQLNAALASQENATLYEGRNATLSQFYSSISQNQSSYALSQALVLQNSARNQSLVNQIVAYTGAILGSVFSAILVLEIQRIRHLLRRRRLLEARVDLEG